MAKKFRRTFDKYAIGNYETALLLAKFCPKEIAPLLSWMEDTVGEHEIIEISNWTGDNIHIIIKDTRIEWESCWHGVEKMRCGFSANIVDDVILWKGDVHNSGTHGNVFVRSGKWKSAIKKNFGVEIYYTKVSRHQNINPVKAV